MSTTTNADARTAPCTYCGITVSWDNLAFATRDHPPTVCCEACSIAGAPYRYLTPPDAPLPGCPVMDFATKQFCPNPRTGVTAFCREHEDYAFPNGVKEPPRRNAFSPAESVRLPAAG